MTDSQVIARVNDQEITVHEMNAEFQQLETSSDAASSGLMDEVVQRLIDRKLFARQARKQGLDRTPDTMLAMELAREQALAQAYVDQLGNQVDDATDEEVGASYNANPAVFANRRYYQVRQMVIHLESADADVSMAQLDAEIAGVATVFDLIDWLEAKRISYLLTYLDEPAEYFAPRILNVLAQMQPGQVTKIEVDKVAIVFALLGTRPAGLDLKTAAPKISATLRETRRAEFVESQLENLRRNAAIVYFGAGAQKSKTEAQR